MASKVIVKIVCGDCLMSGRHVMARIIDAADGPALRASYTQNKNGRNQRAFDYDDVLLSEADETLPRPSVRIGCPRHSWIDVMVDVLTDLVTEYRETGRPVTWSAEHPPYRPPVADTL